MTLPTEIKARIVRLASDQDDKHHTKLGELDEDEEELPAMELVTAGWYGGSLEGISLVNHEFRGLAAPLLFECVRASKTESDVFLCHILPIYQQLFTTVVFDLTSTSRLQATLMLLPSLPNARCFKLLQAAARKLLGSPVLDPSPHDNHIPSDKRRSLAAAFRAAAVRVTHILLSSFDTAEVTRTLECFLNLRQVVLVGSATFKVSGGAAVARALAQYGALAHLEIYAENEPFHESTGARRPADYDGTSDPEDAEPSRPRVPPILDELWGTAAWSSVGSLRKLSFLTDVLRQTDWTFIAAFSGSLESLTLIFRRLADDPPPLPSTPSHFPRLARLRLSRSSDADSIQVLKHLSTAPLQDLELFISETCAVPSLHDALSTFFPSLRHLWLRNYLDRISPQQTADLVTMTRGTDISIPGEELSDLSWIGDPRTAFHLEKHPGPCTDAVARVVEAVTLYAQSLEAQGDTSAQVELLHLLAPYKAKERSLRYF